MMIHKSRMFSSLALVAITAGCINALSVHDLPEIPEVSSNNIDFINITYDLLDT